MDSKTCTISDKLSSQKSAVSLNALLMQLYDSTAHLYDKRHENDTTRHMRKRELEMLKKYAKGSVIDIGCGTGVYSGISDDYAGVDLSAEMIKQASAKGSKKFVAGSAEKLPFADGSFDTAICMFTVLNLCDPGKAAREMSRVLKPRGVAVVSVASVWDRKNYRFIDKLKDRYDSDTKNVRIDKNKLRFRLFTKKEFLDIFEAEGFKLQEFHGVYKWQEPYWNRYVKFSRLAKIKLLLERALPSKTARIFIAVFRKA